MRNMVFYELWNSEKNGGSLENVVSFFDDKEYWWKCRECGFEFKSDVKSLLLRCSKEDLYCEKCCTNLSLSNPQNYSGRVRNLLETYDNIQKGMVVRCPICKELFCANIRGLNSKNSFVCPDCRLLYEAPISYVDMEQTFPGISDYWSSKNEKSASETIALGSKLRYWVVCPRCGKENYKSVKAIKNTGAYCFMCHRSISKAREYSLRDFSSDLADMWDDCEENNMIASDIPFRSTLEGYWSCTGNTSGLKEHKFKKTPSAMVAAYKQGNIGCPVCNGFKVVKGVNDFEFLVPDLAKYWDYDKNELGPDEIYYKTSKKYHFICKYGHKFEKEIYKMTTISRGTYSEGCPVCHGDRVDVGSNDVLTTNPEILDYWDEKLNPDIDLKKITRESNKSALFHCANEDCNNVFKAKIGDRVQRRVMFCEDCRNRNYSAEEREVYAWLRSKGIDVVKDATNIVPGCRFDMYIREKRIDIEYNGVYWHSDLVRDEFYHASRYYDCRDAGISMVAVWEDDYLRDSKLVLSMLLSSLQPKWVKCDEVKEEKYEDVLDFISKNTLDWIFGNTYFGLYNKGSLVAVLILEDNRKLYYVGKKWVSNLREMVGSIEDEGIYMTCENTSLHQLYLDTIGTVVDTLPPTSVLMQNNIRRLDYDSSISGNVGRVYNAGYSVYEIK